MISLIKEAAKKEILPRWQKVIPEVKTALGFKDLVTDADKQASLYILERIRKKFPGSYSEEHKFADRFDHDVLWQIDPVDGTQEFCEGYQDGYATLAALLTRQPDKTFKPVAGIIYRPARDECWYNDGSSKVTWLCRGQEQLLPHYNRNQIRLYQRKVDYFKGINEFIPHLSSHLKLPVSIVESGGAGAAVADLLENKINLIIFNNNTTKDWDVGMAEPLIRALGGFVCDLDGNELTYNRPDVPGLHEPYNLRGYIISIVFKKEEILPLIPLLKFDDRLFTYKK